MAGTVSPYATFQPSLQCTRFVRSCSLYVHVSFLSIVDELCARKEGYVGDDEHRS